MTPDRLASIPRWGLVFDLETHKIQPGLLIPPTVCGAVAKFDFETQRWAGKLVGKGQIARAIYQALHDERVVFIGANIAYDFACIVRAIAEILGAEEAAKALALIFKAYRQHRVFDIQIAQALDAVAGGHLGRDPDGRPMYGEDGKVTTRYSLYTCLRQCTGRIDAKANDEWRLRYHELEYIPIADWPLTARTYPVDDVCNTGDVCLVQLGLMPRPVPHVWDGTLCTECGVEIQFGTIPPCTARRVVHRNLHEVARRSFTAWGLHLGACWAFVVDPDAVRALELTTRLRDEYGELTELGRLEQYFIENGILRPNSSQDMARTKRMVALAYGAHGDCQACAGTGKVPSEKTGKPVQCKACDATGLNIDSAPVPRTDGGGVGRGRDVLFESGDEILMAFAAFGEADKIETTYLPFLREGIDEWGRPRPITLKPNPVLETGRVSYSGVVMLLPRKGGVRECIVARPGHVLSSTDYEAGELITHAQSCLWLVGYSKLAEALLADVKPHNALAAKILGISYDEFNRRLKAGDKQCADTRQAAKPANFGFPGRMGAVKLVLQQRKQGPDTPHPSGPTWISDGKGGKVRGYKGLRFCLLMGGAQACGVVKVTEWKGRPCPPTCKACIEAAIVLRDGWLETWPENRPYFEHVKQVDESGEPIIQHVSLRVRGFDQNKEDPNYGNAIANGYFQGLLADAATDALCQISEECYVGDGPLRGSHLIAFQHDEQICEHPISVAHEAASRVGEIMVETLRFYCPDLAPAVRAEPAIALRWYKGMEPVYGPDKRLIPWAPKAAA